MEEGQRMNILDRFLRRLRRKRKNSSGDQKTPQQTPYTEVDKTDPYAEVYPELSQEERDLLETQEVEEDD
jgi:hypothetical protein